MAEITTNQNNSKKWGLTQKSKKLNTKVDLTPMVDLGFLLITFFIFATTLAQPKAAKFRMPLDNGTPSMPVSKQNTLVIMADSLNNYYTYETIDNAKNLQKMKSIEAVRKSILNKKARIGNYNLSVILKLDPNAKYNNLVQMLDEMAINSIDFYVVDKLKQEDINLFRL